LKASAYCEQPDECPVSHPEKRLWVPAPPPSPVQPLTRRSCPTCGSFPLKLRWARARPVAGVAAHPFAQCQRKTCRRSYHLVRIHRGGAVPVVRISRHLPFEVADPKVEFLRVDPQPQREAP
jgi:hypothetical protein